MFNILRRVLVATPNRESSVYLNRDDLVFDHFVLSKNSAHDEVIVFVHPEHDSVDGQRVARIALHFIRAKLMQNEKYDGVRDTISELNQILHQTSSVSKDMSANYLSLAIAVYSRYEKENRWRVAVFGKCSAKLTGAEVKEVNASNRQQLGARGFTIASKEVFQLFNDSFQKITFSASGTTVSIQKWHLGQFAQTILPLGGALLVTAASIFIVLLIISQPSTQEIPSTAITSVSKTAKSIFQTIKTWVQNPFTATLPPLPAAIPTATVATLTIQETVAATDTIASQPLDTSVTPTATETSTKEENNPAAEGTTPSAKEAPVSNTTNTNTPTTEVVTNNTSTPSQTSVPSVTPTTSATVIFETLTPTNTPAEITKEAGTPVNVTPSTLIPTDTPTVPTNTPTLTNTSTATSTPTSTDTSTHTPTETEIPTTTPSADNTATEAATLAPTGTATHTPIETITPTQTDTATNTPAEADTPTATNTPTMTDTATATATDTPTHTPTATTAPGGSIPIPPP